MSHVRAPSPRVRHHHHDHHLQQQRRPQTQGGRGERCRSIHLSSAGPITLIDRQGASRRNPGSEKECVRVSGKVFMYECELGNTVVDDAQKKVRVGGR